MKMFANVLKEETTVWALYDNRTWGTTYRDWAAEYPVGWNTPSPNAYPGHKGLDVGNRRGQAVYAIASGTVIAASGYDNDARGIFAETSANGHDVRYLHMDILGVNVGDWVTIGQTIGTLGNTGASEGPHVHVDVWSQAAGSYIDPYPYVSGEWSLEGGGGEPEVPGEIPPPSDGTGYPVQWETGRFTANVGINARVEPNINKPKNPDYYLANGSYIDYDRFVVNGDHVWLRATSNGHWYAWRVRGGETFGEITDIPGEVQPAPPTEGEIPPPSDGTGYPVQWEDGVFTAFADGPGVNARVEPNIDKPKNPAHFLNAGSSITYDRFVVNGDHIWLRDVASGHWFAWRVRGGETFGTII